MLAIHFKFLKISGLSKFNTVRSRQPAFHVEKYAI